MPRTAKRPVFTASSTEALSLSLSADGTVLYASIDGDGVCHLGTLKESPP
jgi:hypothetical protein